MVWQKPRRARPSQRTATCQKPNFLSLWVFLYLQIVIVCSIFLSSLLLHVVCFLFGSQNEPRRVKMSKQMQTVYIWWVIFASWFSSETEMKTSLLPGYTSTWRKAGSKNRSSVAAVQQSFGDPYKWNGRCCSSYHSFSANVLGVKWRFRLRVFFFVLRSERTMLSKHHLMNLIKDTQGFLLKLPMTSSQQLLGTTIISSKWWASLYITTLITTRIFAPTCTRRSVAGNESLKGWA